VAEIKAREIRMNTNFDKADKVNLWKNDGFTVDQLMGDIRYKISTALHDAGLSNSTYEEKRAEQSWWFFFRVTLGIQFA